MQALITGGDVALLPHLLAHIHASVDPSNLTECSTDAFVLPWEELRVTGRRRPGVARAGRDERSVWKMSTSSYGIEYLVTWNCRHIANATLRSRIERVCRGRGYEPAVICTPDELMEPGNDNE